jgi:hypothetical protein
MTPVLIVKIGFNVLFTRQVQVTELPKRKIQSRTPLRMIEQPVLCLIRAWGNRSSLAVPMRRIVNIYVTQRALWKENFSG